MSMKAELLRLLRYCLLIGIGSVLAGTLLLTLVWCLPTETIREHVAASAEERLGETPDTGSALETYLTGNRETFTDCIMIQYAFEKQEGKSAFEHAMWAWHSDLTDGTVWEAEESLKTLLAGGDTSGMYLREYSRYWHGYLVYLKPLLLIFTWNGVLRFQTVVQLGLFTVLCILAVRRRHPEVAVCACVGALFMKTLLETASLTMGVCLTITLAALVFLLARERWLTERGLWPEYFLCIGIATSYFDFLTYPLVTLGFPMCAALLLRTGDGLKQRFKMLVFGGLTWAAGYAGMWASKWVIADVTLHTGTIRDAAWNVLGRTEAIGGSGLESRINGGLHTIALNLQEYDWNGYAVLAVLAGLALLCALVGAAVCRFPVRRLAGTLLPYIVLAAIPFAWFVLVQHHSALHARFTFRIMGIAAMAAASAVCEILNFLRNSLFSRKNRLQS